MEAKELNFKFATATEVTELAHQVNPEYKENGYSRIFVCPDVRDIHILRILPGVGADYVTNPDKVVLEHEKVSKPFRGFKPDLAYITNILQEDDLSNWDYSEFDTEQGALDVIDGGFGFTNL